MHAQGRRRLAVGAGLMASAALTLALLAPMAAAAPAVAGDPAGDTVTDADDDRIDAPRADIVSTWAEPRGDGIALGLRVRQTVEPISDGNWASDATYVTWELDTTGDGRRDYEIEYSLDEDSKQLMAFVDRFKDDDEPDLTCEPPATFNAETGYAVVVSRKCLGNPATFAYRVTLNYDTNVKDENADVATDHSPDQGWTNPFAPPATPATPGPAPRPDSPAPTSPPAPPAGTTAPTPEQAPVAATTAPTAQAPSAPVAATPPGSSQVGASAQATATAKGPHSAPQAGAGADPASPRSTLAMRRTGPERVDRLAWLASALILADLGFLRIALRRRATLLY